MIGSGVAAALSGMGVMYAKRQERRMQRLQADMRVANAEMQKIIDEKDEVIKYVYQLYNIARELEHILSSVLSPDFKNVMDFHDACIAYTFDADFDLIRETPRLRRWLEDDPTLCSDYRFTLLYSKHPDVISYVYALSTLFAWIETRKTNHTAVHAFHAGRLKNIVEGISRFIHSTRDGDLRIPLIRQKGIGQNMCAKSDDGRDGGGDGGTCTAARPIPCVCVCGACMASDVRDVRDVRDDAPSVMTSDEFFHRLRSWKYNLPHAPAPLCASSQPSHSEDEGEAAEHSECAATTTTTTTTTAAAAAAAATTTTTTSAPALLAPPVRLPNTIFLRRRRYLLTDRVTKDEMMRKFRFNDRFSRVIRDTTVLFADVVLHKQRFNAAENYTAFMTYAVASCIRRNSRCVAFQHKSKITRIRRQYRADHHRAVLGGLAQRRFMRGIARTRHYAHILEHVVRNALQTAEDIERFARRVEEAYKHFLFECYMADVRGGIVELLCMVRDLIAEADSVIRQDALFRDDIIRSTLRLPHARQRQRQR